MTQTLYCILGETASGKDSIVRMLEAQKWGSSVVSYTTRPMRKGEKDGREHFFVSKEEFDNIFNSDRVLAYTQIGDTGYEYCATIEALGDSNIYVIDPAGLSDLKKNYPDLPIRSIYVYAPLEVRMERARNRSDFDTEFEKRVQDEACQFDEFRAAGRYDYLIDTSKNSVMECVEKVKDIMKEELFLKFSRNFS